MNEQSVEKNSDASPPPQEEWPIPPEGMKLWEDAFGVLHLRVGETEHKDLRARHAFPLSGKADYVSFLDEKGNEVAMVAHPHKLDKESRRALDAALERMYYVAKILRVDSLTETMGVTHWQVQTDRGYASFEVVDSQQIRKLLRGRYMITDVDGNRFEIEDLSGLDGRSQALVQSEV
jgi:hypothetical protein